MIDTDKKSLDALFDAAIDELGGLATKVSGGAGDLFMEIMDTRDLSVWMCFEPVTEEQYQDVVVRPPWMKSGRARASMDRAAFAHSPGKPDEFSTTECGALTFRHVATPQNVDPSIYQSPGVKQVQVLKHHLLGFDAGREITVMDHDGEVFVEMIGTAKGDADLDLPEGASLRSVKLSQPIVVRLPAPTTTFWWFGKARGFQGPVDLPELKA